MARDLPLSVREVLEVFPGITVVRAHQIARDRKLLQLRQRAARQARRNLYGPVEAGGLSRHARATIAAVEGIN